MRFHWKRVALAVAVVVAANVATLAIAHPAAWGPTVPTAYAADPATLALRGAPVSTTDSTGGTVSKTFSTPSAAVAGDLLVASLSYKTPGLSDIANTAPSGWTKVPGELFDISTTTGSHLVVAVKTAAGGAESAAWTFASAPAGMVIAVEAYSGADTTIDPANFVYPFEKYGYKVESGGSSTTTHTAPTFTPTVAGSWGFAAFASRASETWTPGPGLTERTDVRAATSSQATLETDDSNGAIATGSPITYSSTEPAGTSVQVSFAGNIKPSQQAPQPQPPTVTIGSATGITSTAATIAGTINPNGLSTTYHFEYGTTTSYGTSVPTPDGPAGSGSGAIAVSANLSGLTAATTYHYRLVATNTAGTTNSPDTTFTTNTAGGVPVFDHIFTIVMENQSYNEIIGNTSQAPYINQLASQYGVASNYFAVMHPSLSDYLALTGGDTFGTTSNCDTCWVDAPNIVVDRIEASGRTWKAYQESMPAVCFIGSAYPYTQHHNPFIYYNDIRLNPAECNKDVPYTQLATDLASAATTPNYVFITPNEINDMHDGTINQGDVWLQQNVPTILSSPAFTTQKSVLNITWDEAYSQNNQVPSVIISSTVTPGYHSFNAYNHYSWLKTIESAWSLAPLTANDANAIAMADFFPAQTSQTQSGAPTHVTANAGGRSATGPRTPATATAAPSPATTRPPTPAQSPPQSMAAPRPSRPPA